MTTDAEAEVVERTCFDLGVEQLGHLGGAELNSLANRGYLVFLNGLVIGACSRPHKLAAALRRLRRSGKIGEFVSVYAHDVHRAIYIACDGGRVCRPLIVAPKGRSRLTAGILEDALHCRHVSAPNRTNVIAGKREKQTGRTNGMRVQAFSSEEQSDRKANPKKSSEFTNRIDATLDYLVQKGEPCKNASAVDYGIFPQALSNTSTSMRKTTA